MFSTPTQSLTPRELLLQLVERRRWIFVPAGICTALAVAAALVMPRYWEASQALVVRQETAGVANSRPGKFADLYEMKTLQETILELAKSRTVVAETLKAADRQLAGGETAEPDDREIEKFRKRMKMLPPSGAEFGKTEVFYFQVKDARRERAMALVSALCDQLDAGLRLLRQQRARDLTVELKNEVAAAAENNAQQTKKLQEFETSVGADLGELRMMQAGASGQSDLRQEAVTLGNEARRYAVQARDAEKLLELLRQAEQDPTQFLATPNSLLTAQPALRRLKDGLLDAQLATAKLAGTRSSDHPRVLAAVEAETQIRSDFHRELAAAIRGAEIEHSLCRQRYETAKQRAEELEARLTRLASLRAEYANRLAAVETTRQLLDRSRQNLETAQNIAAAATSGSLVTRVDKPETGPYPSGPGRTTIAGAGLVGGLMLGLGLVVLLGGGPSPSADRFAAALAEPAAPAGRDSAVESAGWSAPATVAEREDQPPGVVKLQPQQFASPAGERPSSNPARDTTAEPDAWWQRPDVASALQPVEPRSAAPTQDWTPPEPDREGPATLPTGTGKLPVAAGALPSSPVRGEFGEMTLEEALHYATRLDFN